MRGWSRGVARRLRGLTFVVCLAGAGVLASPLAGQEQVASPEGYPAVGQPPVVRLLSNGAEPRQTLRLQVPEGTVGRLELVMNMSMSAEMGGMALPVPAMPASRMVIQYRITDVADDGVMSYDVEFLEASSAGGDAMVANVMQGLIGQLKGLKGTGRVSSRGVPLESTMDFSAVTDAQMRQALSRSASVDQWVVALPEEAVGVGARWETLQRVSADVLTLFQRIEVEVMGIEQDRVVLATKIEQSAPSQNIAAPQLPPGADAWLESYTGSGAGTAAMRLTSLSSTGSSTVDSTMAMGFAMAGTEQAMVMGTRVAVEVKPAPAGGGSGG